MHGFKSFARRTEIPFENAMNVIVGPNGSGKSNITDALCFVLGRISIKSIRAAKAANLIFSGNKSYKPAQEASVELVFDNEDKAFSFNQPEVSIKRIVRRNGQSIYKINNETKTRQELLELLAQAGIDPHGFNIVLQGEIASFVKMSSDERRKVLEEVAGISIYESRKKKSLKEMEKTEARLKEVSTVLKEKNSYLRNLEKERQEALSYQKLEEITKRCKKTILDKKVTEKKQEKEKIQEKIQEQEKEKQKHKSKTTEKQSQIEQLEQEIQKINKTIDQSTSNEQEALHDEISDQKQKLAGLEVRKENYESRLEESKTKSHQSKEKIKQLEQEISNYKSSSPEIKKQQEQQKKIQQELDILEKKRRKFYTIKSELSTLENTKQQSEKQIIELKKESQMITRAIDSLFDEIKYAKSYEKAQNLKQETKQTLEQIKEKIQNLENKQLEIEKHNAIFQEAIQKTQNLKQDIGKLEVCPLCRNTITEEHRNHVTKDSENRIKSNQENIENNENTKDKIKNTIQELKEKLEQEQQKLNEIDIDLVKLNNAEDKKEQLKRIAQEIQEAEEKLKQANQNIHNLRQDYENLKNIEEEYDEARLKSQELSFQDIDVDTEIQVKQRDLNRLNIEVKSASRDAEESEQELKKINSELQEITKEIDKKEKLEQEIYEKMEKYFSKRNELKDKQKALETDIMGLQHYIRSNDERINNFKIEIARINAEIDSLQTEVNEEGNVELYQGMSIERLQEKLAKAQQRLARIGSVNMRAVDMYEKVEEQCRLIQEKVEIIEKEKEKLEKIIHEIDKKKKKAFLQTLESVNEYFTRNFSQLSKKGEVFLDLEDKKDPFEAGLNIMVKVGRGKYFDVTSLSGGEKTLVALSLIFAIQEYKPYCFYVFDEIDAALDKHNSERLAALIKKYMTSGQYIVVTHNDALISEATTLYGVSMQENISKVISLKI